MGLVGSIMSGALRAHNAAIARAVDDGDEFFLDAAAWDWSEELEAATDVITEELEALLESSELIPSFDQVSELQKPISDERWQTFFFKAVGRPIPGAEVLCPRTAAFIDSVPSVITAMFSILQPGKEIPAHVGPNKAVLRYHLPLVVPTGDVEVCGIRVGDERRAWHVGQGLVFDDTHEHEAWNLSDSVRVVLFLDVVRDVPIWLRPLVDGFGWLGARFHPSVDEIVEKSAGYCEDLIAARAAAD